jgi:DNA repair photolyase
MQNREYNFKRGEQVALLERIPLKIGGVADPFPPLEIKHRITYRILEALHEYDYPCEIQTKNPSIIPYYMGDFNDPNWVVAVTLISLDEDFVRTCEPGAPSPKHRLKAIEKIAAGGGNIICKIQPSIYPKIIKDLPDLVKAFKDSGAFGFNTEGLKVRIVMDKDEVNRFEKIGKYVKHDEFGGVGIRNYYKMAGVGVHVDSDWVLAMEHRKKYTDLAMELADKHNIKYFTADNNMGKIGESCECCGTEVLRDYKIWGENTRTRFWGKLPHESEAMRKVVINSFSYSTDKRRYKTMGEVMDKILYPDQKDII